MKDHTMYDQQSYMASTLSTNINNQQIETPKNYKPIDESDHENSKWYFKTNNISKNSSMNNSFIKYTTNKEVWPNLPPDVLNLTSGI